MFCTEGGPLSLKECSSVFRGGIEHFECVEQSYAELRPLSNMRGNPGNRYTGHNDIGVLGGISINFSGISFGS